MRIGTHLIPRRESATRSLSRHHPGRERRGRGVIAALLGAHTARRRRRRPLPLLCAGSPGVSMVLLMAVLPARDARTSSRRADRRIARTRPRRHLTSAVALPELSTLPIVGHAARAVQPPRLLSCVAGVTALGARDELRVRDLRAASSRCRRSCSSAATLGANLRPRLPRRARDARARDIASIARRPRRPAEREPAARRQPRRTRARRRPRARRPRAAAAGRAARARAAAARGSARSCVSPPATSGLTFPSCSLSCAQRRIEPLDGRGASRGRRRILGRGQPRIDAGATLVGAIFGCPFPTCLYIVHGRSARSARALG